MNGAYAALAGRLRTSLNDLQVVVTRVQTLADKALTTGDDDYWDGVALNLHGFYGGVERLLEDIARTVEESVPAGPGWHQDLLMQMSAEVPGMRPPVILMNTALAWTSTVAFVTSYAMSMLTTYGPGA